MKDIFLRFLRQQTCTTGFRVIASDPGAEKWFSLLKQEGYEFTTESDGENRLFCRVQPKKA